MLKTRFQRAKVSSITSIIYQFISVLCGLIVPKLLISTYGEDLYGATTSITQFLSYIALIEGGIGGVARAAFYKPLAENDVEKINKIYATIKKFFAIIGCIFVLYTVVLGVVFHDIAEITLWSRLYTFLLVLAISISSMGQYFIGIGNLTLLNAAQRYYVNNIASIIVTLLNTVAVIGLINFGCDMLIIKLISSCVYIVKPMILQKYTKKYFDFISKEYADFSLLNQRKAGFGQHIAFFLHTNTDIVLLTVFSSLRMVSVYSVYNMVSSNMQRITRAFTVGMEAVFGDMIAKEEKEQLYKAYLYYDNLVSTIVLIAFGTACVMIIPFIKIYTNGFDGDSYIYPLFAALILCAEIVECLSIPYYNLAIAANHFSKTQKGAYGQAIINLITSIVLVRFYPLEGVAAGTLLAVTFKLLYYMKHSAENIMKVNLRNILKRQGYNVTILFVSVTMWLYFTSKVRISSFFMWVLTAAVVFICDTAFVVGFKIILYGKEYLDFVKRLIKREEAF